jgi:hypothetical protein
MADDTQNSARARLRGLVHFGVAAAILGISAVGFKSAIEFLELATEKQPVPWPKGVSVDRETFKWENLPREFGGRYVLVGDGELFKQIDGIPDGEVTLGDDIMTTLGIGTGWDKDRFPDRSSNWYVARVYRDKTRSPGDPLQYWQLQVYYYTGALDTVPHVPERCLAAGGATLAGSQSVTITIPKLPSPWDEPLNLRRTLYERQNPTTMSTNEYAQYYVFSLNGRPESSWETVRLELAKPWVRHCYFAKIQFYPRGPVANTEQIDRAADEFMNHFLPVVLKALPMPSDVEALGARSNSRT